MDFAVDEDDMKEFEKEMKNYKKTDKGKSDADDPELTSEDKAKLKEATHDKQMLVGTDGEIHHLAEIDFIIKDILKHQDKAFKYKREIQRKEESVHVPEGELNTILEDREFFKADSAALAYTNEEVLKNQRGIIFYLVRKIGINLLTGKSIMNISLPIKMFEPKSLLERYAERHRFAPYYFDKAALVKDPIERMRIV